MSPPARSPGSGLPDDRPRAGAALAVGLVLQGLSRRAGAVARASD